MKDTEALRLLDKEIKNVKALLDPPSDSGDLKRLDAYIQKTTSAVTSAAATVQDVSKYGGAIMEKLDTLRLELERTTIKLQEHVKKVLSNLQTMSTIGEQQGSHSSVKQMKSAGYNVVTPMKGSSVSLGAWKQKSSGSQKKGAIDNSKEILEYAQKMQELERKKQKIEESILQTQILIDKLRKGGGITLEDVEKLKGVVDDWLDAKKQDLIKEAAKEDKEHKITSHQEEGAKDNKDIKEKEQEEKEVAENVKRDEERKREEEERKLKEEERLLKQKEEDEMKKKKEEEILRNEQEKKRMEEEEQNRKKEQEARKREEDERKRIEEERLKKEKEEEEKKKNPDNWNNIEYKRLDSGSVCCQVYAMKDTLEEDDLEVNGNDEWRGDDLPLIALGERPASSVVHIKAKSGQMISSVKLHVSIPYNSVFVSSDESSDEVVLRVSVDGGQWEEREDVATVKPKGTSEGLCMKGINVCQFKTIKLVVIAKPRSQNVVVDKNGTSEQSSVDKRVTLIIPEDTFDESTTVKVVVVPIEDDSLSYAKGLCEHCQNIQSTSSIIRIECKRPTKKEMKVCIRRHQQDDKKRKSQTGKMCHVYKGRDGQWKVPQVNMNTKDSTVLITLPKGEDQYIVLELEFSRDTPKEHFVETANEICYLAHATIVRVIAKQKAENPSMLMVHCMNSKKVSSRLHELKKLGYTLGPDVSKEFPMQNGQKINLKGSGNISLSAGSSQQLTFNGYMDTAKLETFINVVDKYGQLDMASYTGQLCFSVPEENMGHIKFIGTDGTLPLTLPKTDIQLPHHLTALVKFLAFRLTENKRKDWKNVLLHLGLQDELDKIERRPVKVDAKPEDDRYICEIVLRDWITSQSLNEDKVQPIMSSLVKSNMVELKDESSKFIDIYNTFLTDEHLSKMASLVSEDWIMLSFSLGLSDEDINSCKCLGKKNTVEEAYRMFSKWRVSERVARSGSNVINDLLSTLNTLTKFNPLKYYIKGLITKK